MLLFKVGNLESQINLIPTHEWGHETTMAPSDLLDSLHHPMAATEINKGRMSYWCAMRPFVVAWWYFHVGGLNFEEILKHLLHPKRKRKY